MQISIREYKEIRLPADFLNSVFSAQFPVLVALLDRFALVVFLLTLGYANQDLGKTML